MPPREGAAGRDGPQGTRTERLAPGHRWAPSRAPGRMRAGSRAQSPLNISNKFKYPEDPLEADNTHAAQNPPLGPTSHPS